MAVVGLTALVVALLAAAWTFRRQPGVGGPGGVLRPAVLGAVLLLVQSLLGAVTVWLELPPSVVVIHLLNAMALLAAVLVAACRAFLPPLGPAARSPSRSAPAAVVAAVLGAVALLLGAMTANLHAGTACQGFPFCNGAAWPPAGAGGLVHLHWIHRLTAYALTLHLTGMILVVWRRSERSGVRAATTATAAALAVHIGIAVVMVLQSLPLALRVTHAAMGALVWVGLVLMVWTATARPATA
jgi:heme A synthase